MWGFLLILKCATLEKVLTPGLTVKMKQTLPEQFKNFRPNLSVTLLSSLNAWICYSNIFPLFKHCGTLAFFLTSGLSLLLKWST